MRTLDLRAAPQVFPAQSSDFVSAPFAMNNMTFLGIQIVFNGNATGTFTLNASMDGTNWDPVTDSSQAITAPGSHTYELTDASSVLYQVAFSYSSGTSDFTISGYEKGNS
jgi:hypothetical protein